MALASIRLLREDANTGFASLVFVIVAMFNFYKSWRVYNEEED